MQRIVIEKNEAVADLIERILEVPDREVNLVVPKGSRLGGSPSNFRLIAREAGVLNKEISIESVDQEVLALAKAAGIPASHPLFDDRAKSGESASFSDILPRSLKRRAAAPAEKSEKRLKVKPQPEPEPEPEIEPEEEPEEPQEEAETYAEDEAPVRGRRDDAFEAEEQEEQYDTLEEPRRGRGRKILAWGIVLVVLVIGGMWLTAAAFGKATVNITFQKAPWNYDGTVTASVAAKNVDVNGATIPAELTEPTQSVTKSFPATGHTTGGQKAHGTITIVNAYSAASQELVATTRFTTPDGKLYRLDAGVIVPGAKVGADGKVTASSTIQASVTADQPGESYNTGAVAHLNIPGFQGTPKYTGFYGVLAEGASGGSSTGGAAPTDDDIKNAKTQTGAALNGAFQTTFLASIPGDLKVLPQASTFSTTTFVVNRTVDAQGQFSVTASTVFHAFEFREPDVAAFLNGKARGDTPDRTLKDLSIEYSNVSPNYTKKQMTFTVKATATLVPQFDPNAFAATIAGKSENDARQAILALPGLADAKVSLWPAWLWTLPKNSAKITVNVQ